MGEVWEAVPALLPQGKLPGMIGQTAPAGNETQRSRARRRQPGTPQPAWAAAPAGARGQSARTAPAAGASPSATRRRFLGIARPAAANPPPPLPKPTNTTFYEKKTNFSDVTHLWCSGLLGRASRGPGASAVGAERATQPGAARTHNPHSDTQGHTKQEDGRSGSNKGAPDGEVAGRSRGARAGACGCGGRECECVRACVCALAAADTGGPGLRVPAAGSCGRGGGRRTRQGTPRPAHPVPPYGRSFFG